MKLLKALVVAMFLSTTLLAQTDIKQDIIAFTDSTELMIRNGRNLVVDKTVKGDAQGARKTMDYLKENVPDDQIIFYPVEELLLSLAHSNFEMFLFVSENMDEMLDGKTQTVYMNNIMESLQFFLLQELPIIKKDLEKAELNKEDKAFVRLYILYYESDDKNLIKTEVKAFKKKYKSSKHLEFIEKIETSVQTGAMNFCLGYGHEFLQGAIADNFDPRFQSMSFELEWFLNRFYISLFFQGSVEKIYSNSDLPVLKYDYMHDQHQGIYTVKYGMKLGRTWYTTKHINCFSYVSIGGYQIKADKSQFGIPSTEDVNLNLVNTFSPGIGTACDITIKEFRNKLTEQKAGSWFIRPNVAYDFFLNGNEISKGGSLYLSLTMGVGIGY